MASLNYRLSQHASFPAQINDCQNAIRWLRKNAKEYGHDPDRIGVWGSSAGGHLSSLAGTRGNLKEATVNGISAEVQAVCDFCGPSDLILFGQSRPGDILSRLIEGPIQERREAVMQANPIGFIDRTDPPFLTFFEQQLLNRRDRTPRAVPQTTATSPPRKSAKPMKSATPNESSSGRELSSPVTLKDLQGR